MKLRNIVIVLLAALMVFAFASCKNDPEPQPGKDTVAKITVTKGIETSVWGNEKIQLIWDLGADSEGIKDGSVFEMQFRTNRAPYEFDLRNNKKGAYKKEDGSAASVDVRWVYQESADSLDSLTYDEKTGWYTMKYTFSEEGVSGKEPDYDTYRYTVLGVNFKCFLLVGDVFEVKNAKLDGKVLPLTADINNQPTKSELEVIVDHEWAMDKTYVLVYEEEGTSWDSDDGVPAEAVKVGEHPVGLSEAGYTFTYTDSEGDAVDLATFVLEEDTVIDFVKTGVERTVTFDVDGATSTVKVKNGQTVDKPAEDPEKEGYLFDVWCSDSTKETEYNFNTPVTSDITLYARFGAKRTVSFNMMEHGTQVDAQYILDGKTATEPDTPKTSGYRFNGWYTADTFEEEEKFDFATAITRDYELFAKWEEAETVPFKYYMNDGTEDYDEVDTYVGEPASSTRPDDPSRLGYDFVGWFDAASEGTEYPFTEIVEEGGEKSLYAYWTHKSVTKMVAVKGVNEGLWSYDKFSFDFGLAPKEGDTVSIMFRSNRPIDEFNIRDPRENGDKLTGYRWVYGQDGEDAFGEDYVVDDTTGWITFSYTFGPQALRTDKSSTPSPVDVDYENYVTGLYVQFVGTIIAGDYLEIGDIKYNGVSVESVSDLIEHNYVLKGCDDSAISTIDYSAEKPAVTYVVQFLDPDNKDGDGNPMGTAVAVVSGEKVSAPEPAPAKEGFDFEGWNKKADGTGDFWDFDDAVTKDRILYAIFSKQSVE